MDQALNAVQSYPVFLFLLSINFHGVETALTVLVWEEVLKVESQNYTSLIKGESTTLAQGVMRTRHTVKVLDR